MKKILIDDMLFEYTVIKKCIKSLIIKVTADGIILIETPINLTQAYIESILYENANWIKSKVKNINDIKCKKKCHKFVDGENLLYLGKKYLISVFEDKKTYCDIRFDNDNFNILINPLILSEFRNKIIQKTLEDWYRRQASVVLHERTKYYSHIIGVNPKCIKIKSQKTLWGSCSSKGNINYNYRLIFAPINIVDYVVVHELCHMVHLNHSKDFWNLVESIVPNYKGLRKWLNENSLFLQI